MQELKRKDGPASAAGTNPAKRKKGGNRGKWQTPHQRSKTDQRDVVEAGDAGVWVTCARSQETKAAREVQSLFDEYAERLYGLKPAEGDAASDEDEADEDIEASIQKELTSLKPSQAERSQRVFTIVRQVVDCLLFVRTREPVEPVEFVRRICLDAKSAANTKERRCRYLNRFTPITLVGRASEKGVQEVCEKVLPAYFKLKGSKTGQDVEENEGGNDKANFTEEKKAAGGEQGQEQEKETPAYTYAIRATTRNQCPLKREDVIKQIASMIDERHKVNLGNPDKVILVDMYQKIYGMSVVDGDWEGLKRYNISELYTHAIKDAKGSKEQPAERMNGEKDTA